MSNVNKAGSQRWIGTEAERSEVPGGRLHYRTVLGPGWWMVTSVYCLPIYCVLLHHLGNESLCLPSSCIANFLIFFPSIYGGNYTRSVHNYIYASLGFDFSIFVVWWPVSHVLLSEDFGVWQQSERSCGVAIWRYWCQCAGTSKIKS